MQGSSGPPHAGRPTHGAALMGGVFFGMPYLTRVLWR